MTSFGIPKTNQSGAYFIAEIGANHDQSFDRLMRLIDLAKSCGADAIKLQHLTPQGLGSRTGFDQALAKYGNQISQHSAFKIHPIDAYSRAEISRDWTAKVREKCDNEGLDFISSPYGHDDLNHIEPYVDSVKIGSGEISNLELVEAARLTGLTVLLSTGASTIEEVERAVSLFSGDFNQLVLMQCNSDYSGGGSAVDHLNLRVLSHYRLLWPEVTLGVSDHTRGIEPILAAVALGAEVIERHFTDDCSRPGADHKIALTPPEWEGMVHSTRECERALGSAIKRVEANERRARITQRRALRATRDLEVGEVIDRSMVSALRPAPPGSLSADCLSDVLGRMLIAPVSKSDELLWAHLDDSGRSNEWA